MLDASHHADIADAHLSLHTPVGDITVFEQAGAIVSLDWGWVPRQEPSAFLGTARAQLEAYFDGALRLFDLPLAPAGTAYRRQVWQALLSIPYGETRSLARLPAPPAAARDRWVRPTGAIRSR